MKKTLIILSLSLATACINAETVTSSKGEGIISTLPKAGQTVKKGEMLVTFSQTGINAQIDALKIEIKEAKEQLKNKNLDKDRADKLVNKSISKNDWEDATYNVTYAKLFIEVKEAELRKLESDKTHCFIPAPCDCKVTKVYLIENSGTEIGQPILEVERLN